MRSLVVLVAVVTATTAAAQPAAKQHTMAASVQVSYDSVVDHAKKLSRGVGTATEVAEAAIGMCYMEQSAIYTTARGAGSEPDGADRLVASSEARARRFAIANVLTQRTIAEKARAPK